MLADASSVRVSLPKDGACTLHEHCRSHLLDRANFSIERPASSCVKRPRGHHEMAAGARGKVAGAGFGLQPDGGWAVAGNVRGVEVARLHTL